MEPQVSSYAIYNKLFPQVPMDPTKTDYTIDWLCEGLFMKGKINIVFGMEKAGKSRFLGYVLPCLYAEQSIWGLTTKSPGKTLYLAGEELQEEVTARLVNNAKHLGLPAIDWAGSIEFISASGMRLDQPKPREWLRDKLVSEGFETLFFDPLRRIHGGKENDNDAMAPMYNAFREWTNTLGVTIIGTHHTGKLSPEDDEERIGTWSRGATDLPAVLDWALYIKRMRGKGLEKIRVLRRGRAPSMDYLTLEDRGEDFWLC